MADNIVIRLFADPDRAVEWILTDSSGARHGEPSSGTLIEAATAIGSHSVIVLLPSSDMLITTADIPAKGSKLLQAVPFALEEQLAEDIDRLHFAVGQRRSNGLTPVVVTNRERFEDYLLRLAGAGIGPDAIYPEIQGLARIPGTISLLLDDGDLLINDGGDVELDLEQISPGDALVAIGALDDAATTDDDGDVRDMPRHVLIYLSAADQERYSNDWLALEHEFESLDIRILPDGALPRLAATVSSGRAVNLLQGDFAPKRSMDAAWRPWRNVAALFLAVVGVGLIGKVVDYFSLRSEDKRLTVAIEEQFRDTLPWINTVPDNPASRLRSELARMGAASGDSDGADFLLALEALSGALGNAPGSKVEALSYRSGETDIQLIAPNVESLERIQAAVREGTALDAAIARAEPQDDGVKSRIQIKAAER